MPTYDYKCNACGHAFEEFQSMTAPRLKKCPACGKNKLERLIGTGAALMFKGSGFYITDYRSESYKKGAEAEKAKPEGGTAETSKADAGKADAAKAGTGTSESGKAAKAESAPKSAPAAKSESGSKGKKPAKGS